MRFKALKPKFWRHGGCFDHAQIEKKIKHLQSEMAKPDFWKNPESAKSIRQKYEEMKSEYETWDELSHDVEDLEGLLKISAKDEKLEENIKNKFEDYAKNFKKLEFFVLFSGKYDRNNAIFAIHAGAGGVEAQDWAQMLSRMLLRYCEKKGFQTKIIDQSPGQEAGIKSMAVEIFGNYAYGYLRSEAGVHRLVRISPFDAEKMRHTSFALIEVLPQMEDEKALEIKDEDLKIDVFRASGHGGQSVNRTDSAVRITHLPSGLVVKCQNERSQHQNKEIAMRYLKAKLLKLEEERKHQEMKEIRGEHLSADWGSQIRSYVLQPYKMVKDHRTGYEEKEPDSVLDGNIEGFVEEYLRKFKM